MGDSEYRDFGVDDSVFLVVPVVPEDFQDVVD